MRLSMTLVDPVCEIILRVGTRLSTSSCRRWPPAAPWIRSVELSDRPVVDNVRRRIGTVRCIGIDVDRNRCLDD